MEQKILDICQLLRTAPVVMTPKQFIHQFLESGNSDIAFLRRFWAASGIDSTMALMNSMRKEINSTDAGRQAWYRFILQEVRFTIILKSGLMCS
jgi:hypothetical protein